MKLIQSVKLQINLRKVLWIGLLWAAAGVVDSFFTQLLGQSSQLQFTAAYNFHIYFITNLLGYGSGGLIAGFVLVFLLKDRFQNQPFFINLLIKSLVIIGLSFGMSLVGYVAISCLRVKAGILDEAVWQETWAIFLSPYHLKNTALGFMLVMGTIVLLQVADKYGPGVLPGIWFGKYHLPRQEERIFMFLDMKSSTTIAERLGHIQFHNLLNDFFRDIAEPVVYTRGEIYQYVGDEVVITWEMKWGLLNANCIRSFYAIRETIAKRAYRYREKYGLVPEFKAGLHCGQVTTGVIGLVKRDLVHSGDVTNTSARIQDKCNEFGVKILLSKLLLDKLKLPPHSFVAKKMGDIDLRGKSEKVMLYTLEEEVGITDASQRQLV